MADEELSLAKQLSDRLHILHACADAVFSWIDHETPYYSPRDCEDLAELLEDIVGHTRSAQHVLKKLRGAA